MKTGDILKIISMDNYRKDITTTTEGKIILIDQCKITLETTKNKFKESFSFLDFIGDDKRIFVNGEEVKLKREGEKYVLFKITRHERMLDALEKLRRNP
jgi:GTPase SAR1 family protein